MKKKFLVFAFIMISSTSYSQVKVMVPEKQNIPTVKEQVKAVAFRLVNFNELSLPANATTVLNIPAKEFDVSNNECANSQYPSSDTNYKYNGHA